MIYWELKVYIPNKCQDDASVAALIEQEQILIKELQSGHDIMRASRALGKGFRH